MSCDIDCHICEGTEFPWDDFSTETEAAMYLEAILLRHQNWLLDCYTGANHIEAMDQLYEVDNPLKQTLVATRLREMRERLEIMTELAKGCGWETPNFRQLKIDRMVQLKRDAERRSALHSLTVKKDLFNGKDTVIL